MNKKTKIVATIGPATENPEMFEKLARAGMNVARLNFSHGSHEEQEARMKTARDVAKKIGKPIAILQDLSGPKIRIGDFAEPTVELKNGKTFILTTEECVGTDKKVFIKYPTITEEVKKGATILLDDGKVELRVEKIQGNDVYCKVINGGVIKGRRGVNFPGSYLKISSLTAKDKKDLVLGIKNDVDFMALSFVRTPKDVIELRNILKKAKADIRIIAKIETQEAIENFDEILEQVDGIMVARGDLAVEVGAEQVPILQKEIVRKCNHAAKPVIIATQMLESMIKLPVPTRAEVNDVANAIFDGADAVMLSEETTLGAFPLKAVEVMTRVAKHTETYFDYEERLEYGQKISSSISDAVSYAVANVAQTLDAKVIVALTESGGAPNDIAQYRVEQPIIAITPNEKTYNRLALSFGCYPFLIDPIKSVSEAVTVIHKLLIQEKIAKKGDTYVLSAGTPFGQSGTTNLLRVETI